MIAHQITGIGSGSSEFPAYARIASPLCAPGWLACGTAAMAFDPICGDGTAHAIREAILASAVIRAIAKDGDLDDLLLHYEARLTAGFRRHLMLCRQFYLSGGTGTLWRAELDAIDRGIQWCDAKLGAHASFRYQLRGFELEAVR
jgi:flavin-dependent dehydrogenase